MHRRTGRLVATALLIASGGGAAPALAVGDGGAPASGPHPHGEPARGSLTTHESGCVEVAVPRAVTAAGARALVPARYVPSVTTVPLEASRFQMWDYVCDDISVDRRHGGNGGDDGDRRGHRRPGATGVRRSRSVRWLSPRGTARPSTVPSTSRPSRRTTPGSPPGGAASGCPPVSSRRSRRRCPTSPGRPSPPPSRCRGRTSTPSRRWRRRRPRRCRRRADRCSTTRARRRDGAALRQREPRLRAGRRHRGLPGAPDGGPDRRAAAARADPRRHVPRGSDDRELSATVTRAADARQAARPADPGWGRARRASTSVAPSRVARSPRGPARAATTVLGQLDELTGDAGRPQLVPRARWQGRGELDERVVGADVDVAEVRPAEAALVGERADDLARLDPVAAPDGDPVGGHRAGRATAGPTVATVAAVVCGHHGPRASRGRRVGRRDGHGSRGRRTSVRGGRARGRAASARHPGARPPGPLRRRPRARCARSRSAR